MPAAIVDMFYSLAAAFFFPSALLFCHRFRLLCVMLLRFGVVPLRLNMTHSINPSHEH